MSTTDLDVARVMTGIYIRPRLMACLAICSVYNDKGGQVRSEKLFHLGAVDKCVVYTTIWTFFLYYLLDVKRL